MLAEAATLPDVAGVSSPYDNSGNVSADGSVAFGNVQYATQITEIARPTPSSYRLIERASGDGLTVELGAKSPQIAEQQEPASSELIGIAAAAVILVVAFGSVVAMGVPIIMAVLSLGGAIALITSVREHLRHVAAS